MTKIRKSAVKTIYVDRQVHRLLHQQAKQIHNATPNLILRQLMGLPLAGCTGKGRPPKKRATRTTASEDTTATTAVAVDATSPAPARLRRVAVAASPPEGT